MKNIVRFALLCGTAITFPALALADPATAVGLAVTVGSGLAASAIGGTVGALVSAAISIAGTLAIRALTPRDSRQQAEFRSRSYSPHPPIAWAYGEFKTEGDVIALFSEDAYFYAAFKVSSRPCEDVTLIEIDDGISLPLADSSGVYDMDTGSEVANIVGSNPGHQYDGDVTKIWIGLGTQTKFPQDWIDGVSDLDGSEDGFNGATVVFFRFRWAYDQYDASRWRTGMPPPLRFTVKGTKVYDPRKDSTAVAYGVTGASGSHRHDDESTWEWTSNPALIGLDAITHAQGLSVADTRILLKSWADAADDCGDSASTTANLLTNPSFETDGVPVVEGWPTVDVGGGEWTRATLAKAFDYATPRTGTYLIYGDTNPAIDPYQDVDVSGYSGSIDSGRETADASIYFHGGSTETNKTVKLTLQFYDSGMSLISSASSATYTANDLNGSWNEVTVSQLVPATCRTIRFLIDGTGPGGSQLQIAADDASLTLTSSGTTGYGARFRCDGLLVIDTDEWSLLDPIMDSMGGFLDTATGKIGVRAAVWRAPADTLSAPIGDGFEYVGRSDPGFDKVIPAFISRLHDYQETDGDEYVLKAGDRAQKLPLSMVREPEQAALLAQIFALRARHNREITQTCSGQEWGRRIGENVTISSSDFARMNGTYFPAAITPVMEAAEGGGMRLQMGFRLREDAEEIHDWPPGAGWTDPAAVTPPSTAAATIIAPSSVTAEQSDYKTSPAGSAIARLKGVVTLTSAAVTRADTVRIEVDDGSGYSLLSLATPATSITVYLAPASEGVTYTLRARTESGTLGPSDWVTSDPVEIIAPVLDFNSDFSAEFT